MHSSFDQNCYNSVEDSNQVAVILTKLEKSTLSTTLCITILVKLDQFCSMYSSFGQNCHNIEIKYFQDEKFNVTPC